MGAGVAVGMTIVFVGDAVAVAGKSVWIVRVEAPVGVRIAVGGTDGVGSMTG